MPNRRKLWCWLSLALVGIAGPVSAGPVGYYRQPAIHGQTIVFVAEGDLWKVDATGGAAARLTSHAGDEAYPHISPDGRTVAFTASYEGPLEVYTMPLAGGLPTRVTCDGEKKSVAGFAPDGQLLYATSERCTLPGMQLMRVNLAEPEAGISPELLPLWQAAEGCYDDAGQTLFFTRFIYQGSSTKRYRGGLAQNLWRYSPGDNEAIPLTADYTGTSRSPMWHDGRLYFASDRDGCMNLWSMKPDGSDLRQHTQHKEWDVLGPSIGDGKIVYQLGADIHLYDLAADTDAVVPITLETDLDQTRENWIRRPAEYLTSAHVAPDGGAVALTARGQVFVAPFPQGRLVRVTHKDDVRYRNARFLPDGKTLVALSDESGEVELWTLPANGIGESKQLTDDGDILRWDTLPSPDGNYIAHHDKGRRLFLYNVKTKENRKIDEARGDDFSGLAWSPDSAWLAYVAPADNNFKQVRLYDMKQGTIALATSDRFESTSPAFSPDGKWLYLLSDRNLESVVPSPWGNYAPEPYLDRKTEIFMLALRQGDVRSPFAPRDELHSDKDEAKSTKPAPPARKKEPATTSQPASALREWLGMDKPRAKQDTGTKTRIDLGGLQARLLRVPVPAGNYGSLEVNEKALFWLARSGGGGTSLQAFEFSKDSPDVKTVASGVSRFEMTPDGKKLFVQTHGSGLHIIDANPSPADLDKKAVSLSGWALSVIPRQEWRQMFVEAWRLERDYFYDPNMHGVDWKAIRKKYEPLVERVTSRAELSDLFAQMVGELSALHIFVKGGDLRSGDENIAPSSLGAVLVRDAEAGGYRVEHLYRSDYDDPDLTGPLRKLDVNVKEGDVITMVNGQSALSAPDIAFLLRGLAGQQVLLHVKSKAGGDGREVIVKPISMEAERDLRYHEWEHTRRLMVEKAGQGKIGYVHLRAMGRDDYTAWAKSFYPVWNRDGLIIDVRNNLGGNIDPWILGRLMRKAWFFWADRFGRETIGAMQYAFAGHVAVLCNERTSSDGEAFCDGIQRLELGKVIGIRTWGGAIWLSSSNVLVDKGIATAAESGTFAPEGHWLIEGHGIDPDMVVDNLPYATFKGGDAQLQAAIDYLEKKIHEEPVKRPEPPKFPDKSLKRAAP